MNPSPQRLPSFWLLCAALFFLTLVFALLLGLNMRRGLNHDEHQFIASGKLVSAGLLPYADFPFFHAPTLSVVYALLFRLFDPLLLSARLFSIVCTWLSLVLILVFTYRRLDRHPPALRLLAGVSIILLWIATPLFTFTSGRAWNHDFPTLLALMAFILCERGLAGAQQRKLAPLFWCGVSGWLIGLAGSTRLSFAFLGLAVVAVIGLVDLNQGTLWPLSPKRRGTGDEAIKVLAFLIGALLGFAPALLLLWYAPEPFFFGNLEYVRLNTLYYRDQNLPDTPMTLIAKLGELARLFLFQPGNALLLLTSLATLLLPRWLHLQAWNRHSAFRGAPWALNSAFILFTLIGALAATPSQTQYFYPLTPWLALGIVYGLATWPQPWQLRVIGGMTAFALIAALLAIPTYAPGLAVLFTPQEWYPWKAHNRAHLLATLVDRGKVLTLAPTYPLEGDVEIYPALATGPFAWRVAHLVEAERRTRLRLMDGADLTTLWQQEPPRGVLISGERDDAVEEATLIEAASAHGYAPISLPNENTLWLSPLAQWGDAIQLVAHTLPGTPLTPGESFFATFYLQATQPLTTNLNALVRLVDADGAELLRREGWPWGAATSTWSPGAVWPDGREFTIPTDARPGLYRVEMSFYDPATLGPLGNAAAIAYLRVGEPPSPDATLSPLAEFGDQLTLRTAYLAANTVRPGATLMLHLLWQAQRDLTTDYTVFVHLVGADGRLVAQHDAPPLNGFYPTYFWRADTAVADQISIPLPNDLAAASYDLLVGVYATQSLQRLPVTRNSLPAGDRVLVAAVTLE